MKIRKEFRVESAHIVRNCTSHRCSHSIHGHSAVIEVFLESNELDNAQMVYDFGLMKGTVKQFIDSMDHCYLLCSNDSMDFKDFVKESCDRWIEVPFNPSAEMLSLFCMYGVKKILENTITNNGESLNIKCTGVRYHETTTGWAECDEKDYEQIWETYIKGKHIGFSDGVMKDWSSDLKTIMIHKGKVENPIIKQQINL